MLDTASFDVDAFSVNCLEDRFGWGFINMWDDGKAWSWTKNFEYQLYFSYFLAPFLIFPLLLLILEAFEFVRWLCNIQCLKHDVRQPANKCTPTMLIRLLYDALDVFFRSEYPITRALQTFRNFRLGKKILKYLEAVIPKKTLEYLLKAWARLELHFLTQTFLLVFINIDTTFFAGK